MPDPVRLLLDHFPDLTRLPGSIPELRKLILQRAVRGELTADWRKAHPDTEPASVLLEKIRAEKARLVKAGKVKMQQPLPEIGEDEVPFGLPEGWEWCRLGDYTQIVRGITFPSDAKTKKPGDERLPCLRTANVQDEIKWDDLLFIDKRHIKNEHQIIIKGDIVISMANSRELVGKVAIINHLPHVHTTFGGFLSVIRSIIVNKYFLLLLLKTNYARNSIIASASQTTNIANISLGKLNPFCSPLPPLAEQQEIVARVERLLGLCDQLETAQKAEEAVRVRTRRASLAALDGGDTARAWHLVHDRFGTLIRTPEDVRELRKSILQLAVRGELTADWRRAHPNNEPASVLLEKIKAEKARLIKAGKIKKQQSLPEIGEDEVPFEVPEGWVWARMDEICFGITSGSTPPKQYFLEEGIIPFLKVYNIRNQKIDFEFKRQFVEKKYHKEKMKRSLLYPGDVVMNIVGPPLGKVAIVPDFYPEWNCNQAVVFFRPINIKINQFIYQYLKAGIFLDNIELIGTAGQDNISVTKSRMIICPLPPLTEQQEIVTRVERLFGMCDRLEAGLVDAGETGSRVWRALGAG